MSGSKIRAAGENYAGGAIVSEHIFQFDTYEVGSIGFFSPVENRAFRAVVIRVRPIARAQIRSIEFRFLNPDPRNDSGFLADDGNGALILPYAQFDEVYKIVQTESPLYLAVTLSESTRVGSGFAIDSWMLSSSKEPIGEGLRDTSS